MKSAGKARNNGLYRHIRTSKEIIRNLLNDFVKNKPAIRCSFSYFSVLFSKAFFILLHRRCDKLSLFQGTRRNVRWTFQGQATRSVAQ